MNDLNLILKNTNKDEIWTLFSQYLNIGNIKFVSCYLGSDGTNLYWQITILYKSLAKTFNAILREDQNHNDQITIKDCADRVISYFRLIAFT